MRYWICYRLRDGQKCHTRNEARKQKCVGCGGERPARRRPTHMRALDLDYDHYIAVNGGADRCGICLRPRTEADRRFDRDHDHRTGRPRGLLCHKCNRALPSWITPEWLEAAAGYLRRAACQ